MGRPDSASRTLNHADSDRRTQLVVVALPDENDQVHKVSSEKVPHLTLLYLGEPEFTPFQFVHIMEFVEHAASNLTRFSLDVESRGTLGDKNADVLFFNKKWSKHLAEFRQQLLQDPLIFQAFHSTEQFEGWTPHLTLGYPETPAKTTDMEYGEFYNVRFNRIAVWLDDSSGPEFKLKDYDYDMEVAMSDLGTPRPDVLAGVLEHYGVKGMKWGVRRSDAELAKASSEPKAPTSADSKAASAAQAKINKSGTQSLSNQELQGLITRMNLERQYSTMTAQHPNDLDRGLQTVQKVLKVGKTVEDVRKFMKTDTGKAVATGVKGALAAAAAYATGGATAAAGAGASVVIRNVTNR